MGSHHHHSSSKNLRLAFFLNLVFTILEFVGGLYVNSVAILSDAVHDLGDSLSIGTAWYLDNKSHQKPDGQYSYGYARFSLLGALINSFVLIVGSIYVISEAVARLKEPETSDANGMFWIAIIGVAVNGYAAWKVSGGKSLNEKVITWHLMEDILGWVAVLVVSIILMFTDSPYLDPALSLFITAYILWGVLKRLKETLFLFLQGVPADVDLPAIEKQLLNIHHIRALHHTHIWSLEGEHHVFSTHLELGNIDSFAQILAVKAEAKKVLEQYHFEHITIETELDKESCSLFTG